MLSNCGIAQDTTFQIVEKKAMQIKGLAKSAEKTGNPYIALEYYKELVALKPEKDRYLLKLANLYMYTRNSIVHLIFAISRNAGAVFRLLHLLKHKNYQVPLLSVRISDLKSCRETRQRGKAAVFKAPT